MSDIQKENQDIFATDSAQPIDSYRLADLFSNNTNRCLFITGKAGSGKTTFLRRLHEQCKKRMAIVAPTGVAAINAGGVTIHSFFQLPIRTFLPTQETYRQIFAEQRMHSNKRNMLYQLELLVIDEISMVRADVMDAIDMVLRRYKHRQNLPFGGVQVVMLGDLFQLSPVMRGNEDAELLHYYNGPYFFQSKVIQEVQPAYIEFDHIFRQQNTEFIRILNEVRENHLSPESRELLNSRYIPDFKNDEKNFHITLTTHNQTANLINQEQLEKIDNKTFTFRAKVNGQFPENSYPTDSELQLKIGARVMFIKNDDQHPRRFYNGKMGVVHDIDTKQQLITVACEEELIVVGLASWQNIRYNEDPLSGEIEEEELGTFLQYPLRLAWAVTIHKSQGLTFDNVIIDAARAFASGQVYVALSRCRTLDGIVLTSPLDRVRLDNDRQVIAFTNSQPTIEKTSLTFARAQAEYLLQLLCDLYDYRRTKILVEQLRMIVAESVSFNKQTTPYLQSLNKQIAETEIGSESFQRQLTSIILSPTIDYDFLKKRIGAASNFYVPKIDEIIIGLKTMPCRTKNHEDAMDFISTVAELYGHLYKKMLIMSDIPNAPSVDTYMNIRNSVSVPEFAFESIFEKPQKSVKKSDKKSSKSGANAPWTDRDDYELANMFKQGMSAKTIAAHFNRTVGAIKSRLNKIGLK